MREPGEILGEKYRLLRSLGTGGMGEVFLATHELLDKQVAVKFLHPHVADDDDAVKRFYREAQSAAALRHHGIVDVYDVGWDGNGTPYIIMEYLEGQSLDELISSEGGTLEPMHAAEIGAAILSILTAVHEQQIAHRDLKPENVFVCAPDDDLAEHGEADLKLLDFGVSKMLSPETTTKLTKMNELLGTVPYMAPEQVTGDEDLDHRVDIWGVGAILYRALTGHPPYTGTKPYKVLLAILKDPVTPPRELRDTVPAELDAVVCKALSKDPGERYQSAAEFRSHLLAVEDGLAEGIRIEQSSPRRRDETFTDVRPLAARRAAPPPSTPPPHRAPPPPTSPPPPPTSPPPTPPPRLGGGIRCLKVLRGLDAGSLFKLGDEESLLGRDPSCQLVLADESISRRHARISTVGDSVVIEDLESKNGMSVNGTPTPRASLREGDRILLGTGTLVKLTLLDALDVEHHEQLYESLAFDILTGALNRRAAVRQLAAEWSYARRHRLDMSVVLMDVDRFARVNERVGVDGGDVVLKGLARLVLGSIRGEDLFGRHGGECFLVASVGIGHKGAMRFARRLRKAVARNTFHVGDQAVKVTVSVGVATARCSRSAWPEDLVELAQQRLDAAKRAGRNREVGG